MRRLILPLCLLAILYMQASSIGGNLPGVFIRINQVGYLPADQKVALVLTNQNLNGHKFSVTKNPGGISFEGSVGPDRGAYGNYAHVYETNFSTLRAEGSYRIHAGGSTSLSFPIGSNLYAPLLTKSLTFFKVQRCGNTAPLKHRACHLNDGFAAGGWHDAGDYLKFVVTVAGAATHLLLAYERHPGVFVDSNKNGKPDVLDEALIGLKWTYNMWDSSHKTLFYQVGDESDHQQWRLPDNDDQKGIIRKVYPCDPGKGGNVAGKAAASLALASVIWSDAKKPFADHQLAARYLAAARQIYDYGKTRKAPQPAEFYGEGSWRDDIALAAIELYRATKEIRYLNEARSYARAAKNGWSTDWSEQHSLAHYEIGRVDASYRQTAIRYLELDLEAYRSQASTNPFRASLSSFYWGSATVLTGQALEMLWYEDLSGKSTFRALAQQQRDYVLGGNPWGVCWVNSAGKNWARHPHHQIADITGTQLVGFWSEGPDTKTDWLQYDLHLRKSDRYASFQSDAAIYHDDAEDYVTNEPTIFSNAVGIDLLSWYTPSR